MLLPDAVTLEVPFDPGLLCDRFGLNQNITCSICVHACMTLFSFAHKTDFCGLLWRMWLVDFAFPVLFLDRPSISTENTYAGSVFLVIPCVSGLVLLHVHGRH